MSEQVLKTMDLAIKETLSRFPDTVETRCAVISLFLTAAAGMANAEPEPLRQHWAKCFYKEADKLCGPKR